MLFWLAVIALSAAAAAVLVAALIRGGRRPSSDFRRDVEFYRSQLAEIEAERQRGQLSGKEAEISAREVSRRLLRAHDKADLEPPAKEAPRLATALACTAVIAVLIPGALAIHWQIGEPGLEDMPLRERLEAAEWMRATRPSQQEAVGRRADWSPGGDSDAELLQLVASLRNSLSVENPDPQGLRLLVRSELSLGNRQGAIEAQRRLIARLGDSVSASEFSELADLLVSQTGGYVSPEAELAAMQALELDDSDVTARYYVGLMFGQTGRLDLAVSIWSRLLNDLTEDAPMYAFLRDWLPVTAEMAGMNAALPPPRAPAPSEQALAAAQAMSDEERAEYISGMVSGLRQRLNEEGGTASDWTLLIHSLIVLGDTDAAAESFERAKQIFADSPQDLRSIAESTGIEALD